MKQAQKNLDWKLSRTENSYSLKFTEIFVDGDADDLLTYDVKIKRNGAYVKLSSISSSFWLKYDTVTQQLKGRPDLKKDLQPTATGFHFGSVRSLNKTLHKVENL